MSEADALHDAQALVLQAVDALIEAWARFQKAQLDTWGPVATALVDLAFAGIAESVPTANDPVWKESFQAIVLTATLAGITETRLYLERYRAGLAVAFAEEGTATDGTAADGTAGVPSALPFPLPASLLEH